MELDKALFIVRTGEFIDSAELLDAARTIASFRSPDCSTALDDTIEALWNHSASGSVSRGVFDL